MASKGKAVAGKDSSGKRKLNDSDKTGSRKRKNPGVLQFFEDAAAEFDENGTSDDSDFDDDFLEDECDTEVKVKNEPGKAHNLPFLPKEEELSEEELEKMLEERYKPGSSFVTYAEGGYESKRSVERNSFMPSAKDPTIWKVKCMVGRERHSAFCLMQKYVDLRSLGTKMQIISAFALEHVKGFIYIEADKQCDINEACKGLCSIYSTRVAPVPKNEVSHLLSVRSKYNEVSAGSWARVKNGKYKGDLAQVMAMNGARKKATVKLIPRIDLQVMAEKFGGGVTAKKTTTPAPRLISSSELEDFQPLIQYKRDRDTGEICENLDGMMLKDGYLYKKVSIDSLSCWGVTPSEDELLKFRPSKKEESDDVEWLSQLYGDRKKKRTVKIDKGGGKGEGSSSSSVPSGFEVHDLVFFGRKDFGVVIGTEKDDVFKILKEGSEGPVVATVELHKLKNASFDKKLTAVDQHMKAILVNDTVRVLEGPSKGRQGTVKQIYKGTIFLYDENELENNGYFCSKSQMCEKVKFSDDGSSGKGGKSGTTDFDDFVSSPKSPLSPKQTWQASENNSNVNREDKYGMFSVGQALRIRVGPLKGYLCRVLAVRRSDVTVKLDSQQKVLTVKCEHLSEVRGKSSTISMGEDPESVKPFDLLGTQDSSRDWMDGAATSAADGERWTSGGLSTERSSWPPFSTPGFSLQPECNSANPLHSVDNNTEKDVGDAAWESKAAPNQKSSWGTAVTGEKSVANNEQVGGWGKSEDTGFGSGASDSWGRAKISTGDQAGSSKVGDIWGNAKLKIGTPDGSSNDAAASEKSEDPWNKGQKVIANPTNSWNNASAGKNSLDSWGKGKDGGSSGSTWGKAVESHDKGTGDGIQEDSWGKGKEKWNSKDGSGGSSAVWNSSTAAPENQTGGWGNAGRSSAKPEAEASGWKKATGASGGQGGNWGNLKKDGEDATGWGKGGSTWGKAVESQDRDNGKGIQEDSCRKAAEKWSTKDGSNGRQAVWNCSTVASDSETGGWCNTAGSKAQTEAESSGWNKTAGASKGQTENWGNMKKDGGDASGWNKAGFGKQDQTDSWNKPKDVGTDGGSSWNKQDGGSSWKKQDGGSSWSKQNEGSSWSKQADVNAEDESRRRIDHQNDNWGKPKSFSGDQGSGGWNKGRMGNKDDTDQQDSWERPKTFDGGRGSGGRRGRGGGRGGRDQFGRGRSFGQGQSSGWSKQGEENCGTGDSMATGNLSSWNSGQAGWGNTKPFDGGKNDDGWNKPNVSEEDKGSSCNKGWDASKEMGGSGDKWNSAKPGWNEGSVTNQESGGSKGHGDGWNTGKASTGDLRSGWKSGTSGTGGSQSDWDNKSSDRSNSKVSNKEQSSVWNKSFTANEEAGGTGDHGGGWNKRKAPVVNQSTPWKTTRSNLDGNHSTGWDSKSDWDTQKTSQNRSSGGNQESADSERDVEGKNQRDGWNSRKTSGGGSATGWGQSSQWKSGTSDAGGNQDSSWRNKSSWNSGNGFGGSGTSDTGGNQDSSWGNKSNWNSGNAFGGSENQTDTFGYRGRGGNWRGGRGGRGGSDRGFGGRGGPDTGGFGGRGGPDTGGFGGRGGSDRGGFRGRGGSDRGGFRGRGRGRRDQSGDWNNRNDSGEDKPYSWNKGSNNNNEAWKSNDGGGSSWNQGGGDKGQWQSWNSGSNPSKGPVESGGTNAQAGGWNKGSGSGNGVASGSWNQSNAADGGQSSGWNKGSSSGNGGASGSWNQSNAADKGQSSGWNKGSGSGNGDASGSRNQSNAADGGQSSGWNKGSGSGNGGASGSWNPSNAADGGQSSGWNKGSSSGNGGASGSWNQSNAADGGQSSGWNKGSGSGNGGAAGSWNQSNAADGGQSSGWNKGSGSGNGGAAGSWNQSNAADGGQSSGWNKGSGSGNGGAAGSWNQSNAAAGGQSSGWNQPKDAKGANEAGPPTDSCGKVEGSPWGKGHGGGGKGGW